MISLKYYFKMNALFSILCSVLSYVTDVAVFLSSVPARLLMDGCDYYRLLANRTPDPEVSSELFYTHFRVCFFHFQSFFIRRQREPACHSPVVLCAGRLLPRETLWAIFIFSPVFYHPRLLPVFLLVGLNNATWAQLSREAPWGSFADFVEWVLVSCRSVFTIDNSSFHTYRTFPVNQ